MTPTLSKRKRSIFWALTLLIVVTGIELGARLIERVENAIARHRNPFVESVNPVPAFKISSDGGPLMIKQSGLHPMMNIDLRPFALERPKGGLRIFVLGGSAAAGWPYNISQTDLSSQLERKLKILFPGRPIEVINAAAGTYASHRVKLILEEVLRYNPDAIFLYNGNNEFLENLVYRPRNPPPPWDHSSVFRLVYRAMMTLTVPLPRFEVKNYDIDATVPKSLAFAFSKASLYREDPRQFKMLLDHYRFNIEEMVAAAGAAKVPLFLLSCPVNIKDWVPNVSRHRKDLPPEEKNRSISLFRDGFLAIERGDFAAAISPLRKAIALDDEYAEAHYRLAEALRRTGQRTEAKAEYILALQRDAFPFRELPEFQSILKEIAVKRGVHLIDIVKSLEAVAGDGILGLDVLIDYCHLTERSQEIVAHEMLSALRGSGLLQGVSAADVERVRIVISSKLQPAHEVDIAESLYHSAMDMQQYEQIDALYEKAMSTFSRALTEDQAIAERSRYLISLLTDIHKVLGAYRDLRRAQKLGLLETTYTPEEAQRIFTAYREMMYQVYSQYLSREEFDRKTPVTLPH
jgi:tetratricopeptide (TPR) repeat protein